MSQRKKLKLSQSAVGNLVGLKQKTISAFENKPESIQLETLFKILSALNLDLTISDKGETEIKNSEWNDEW
ncbi:MAG: helix-turn-helix domain-containing protein [Tatlockia sp.]|nr:helix-turn-helix domain-containing protein [Tatlockia sp.]